MISRSDNSSVLCGSFSVSTSSAAFSCTSLLSSFSGSFALSFSSIFATIFFLFTGTSSSLITRLIPCKRSFASIRFAMPSIVSANTTVSLPSLINSMSSAIVLSSRYPASTIIRSLPLILSIEFITPFALRLFALIFNTVCFIFVSSFTSLNTSIAFSRAFCPVIPSTIMEPGLLIKYSFGSLDFGAFAFITFPCTGKSTSLLSSFAASSTLSSITTVSPSSSSMYESDSAISSVPFFSSPWISVSSVVSS